MSNNKLANFDKFDLKFRSEHELVRPPESDSQQFISFFYNEKLHLLQCFSQLPERQQKLFVFQDSTFQWKPFFINNKNKIINYFQKAQAAKTVVGNSLYCFGGKDYKYKNDNRLAALNLEKRTWKCQIDLNNAAINNVPENRVNAFLQSFKERYLILYGGSSTTEIEISNSFWVFDLENLFWYNICTNIPILLNPSVCLMNQRLYIFSSKQGSGAYISQLFEYRIDCIPEKQNHIPLKFEKTQSIVNLQKPNTFPGLASNYSLLEFQNKSLILFEIFNKGTHSKMPITKIWIFDTTTQTWIPTHLQINKQPSSVIYNRNGLFYLLNQSRKNQPYAFISLNKAQANHAILVNRHKQWRKCEICYQVLVNNNQIMQPAFKVSQQLINSLTEKINFPFAAFGIFADIALSHTASYINFKYTTYRQNPILIVEDDSRLNYTSEQLEEVIVNFSSDINFSYGTVEKRARSVLLKDFIKKQFGTNLKIASMRLGEEMLFVNVTPNCQARVAYFTKEGDQYVCYYYAFDEKLNKVFDDYCEETKFYLESKFGQLICLATHDSPTTLKYAPYKTTVFILKPKLIKNENGQVLQLSPSFQNKDILNISHNEEVYRTFVQYGCKLNESIDVSLCSYLSYLFIRNEHMKISVQIKEGQKRIIKREEYGQNVDKVGLMKVLYSIDPLLKNYDLKSLQLTFNSKVNKKYGIFHNGILIYHKNRLVKRFKYDLGQLLNQLQESKIFTFGFFDIFGKLQLPDSLEVNQQKTDFTNQMMLQKLYSRLNYIIESFKQKTESQNKDGSGEGKNKDIKFRTRFDENQMRIAPLRKTKRFQQDEQYNGE